MGSQARNPIGRHVRGAARARCRRDARTCCCETDRPGQAVPAHMDEGLVPVWVGRAPQTFGVVRSAISCECPFLRDFEITFFA